jgi:copper chaperone
MTEMTVTVSGMRCRGCARVVTSALRNLPGVTSTQADPHSETAVIKYDDRVIAPDAILAQIKTVGFDVSHAP